MSEKDCQFILNNKYFYIKNKPIPIDNTIISCIDKECPLTQFTTVEEGEKYYIECQRKSLITADIPECSYIINVMKNTIMKEQCHKENNQLYCHNNQGSNGVTLHSGMSKYNYTNENKSIINVNNKSKNKQKFIIQLINNILSYPPITIQEISNSNHRELYNSHSNTDKKFVIKIKYDNKYVISNNFTDNNIKYESNSNISSSFFDNLSKNETSIENEEEISIIKNNINSIKITGYSYYAENDSNQNEHFVDSIIKNTLNNSTSDTSTLPNDKYKNTNSNSNEGFLDSVQNEYNNNNNKDNDNDNNLIFIIYNEFSNNNNEDFIIGSSIILLLLVLTISILLFIKKRNNKKQKQKQALNDYDIVVDLIEITKY
ncbi:hypothetical protein PIROE2DRAFT_15911 [Piromyces sp. E2]|nr:hypothetical protein PIROE2DRAFT_15911 [Piromyces sp. E2]|eukprot:OUM58737.1 hypothetical protein PIROE2DRAFT_15911 [Piromyces sp. E2]